MHAIQPRTEPMTSGSSFLEPVDRSLRAAQLRTLRETLGLHAAGSLLWPLILAWAFSTPNMGPLNPTVIAAWTGLVFAWGLGGFAALGTRLRNIEGEARQARAEALLVTLYGLNSVIYVLLPFLMWVEGNPHNNYFLLLIIIANTLFVFQLAVHRTIFLIMLAPPLISLTTRIALDGAAPLVPYAVMGLPFLLWAASLGHQFNNQILHAIKTGLNNRALADDLGVARDEALRQKRAADEANSAKSSFLATMSHELRTPLNAIIGFAQIIRMKLLGEDAVDKYAVYAGDIEDSGKHLLGLINQILDLAKIEAGGMAFSFADVDVCAVVDECAHSMRIRAEEKGMALTVARSHPSIIAHADEMAVRQMVLNLISNSVKFTATGSVSVAVNQTDSSVEISVSDTGCGIAPEDLQRIFQPFEQVDNSLARLHGGTGLGLPIVAKLAEAHDGICAVESVVGKGSRFSVRFPIVKRGMQKVA